MLNDLKLSLEECLAVLESFVQSNKLSHAEIYDTVTLVRERGEEHPKEQLVHSPPHRDDTQRKKRHRQQLQGGKRNESLLQSRYRHVAIRIAYDGSTYNGFAENCGSSTDNSVEKQVFAALTKTCLIASRSTCNYSRCGRTDRGVSAFGQVIALLIRSRIPKLDGKGREIGEEELPKNSFEPISVLQKKVDNNHKQGLFQKDDSHNTVNHSGSSLSDDCVQELTLHEFDYCRILNGVLPDTIRAIGWTPVSPEFSARFSAMDRTYRYFFVRKNYNLSTMQRALDKLIGTHDFRNLCKMDTEAVSNFQRCIKYAKLVVIDDPDDNSNRGQIASTRDKEYRQMCYFEICGQAFLWHMIRCIVAVCFMVGAGYEEPSIMDDLLDINKCPAKPSYAMAPDLPLVLHSCSYQNVTFGHSSVNLWELTNTLERRWGEAAIAAERIRNALESLMQETYVQIDEFCSFFNDTLRSKQHQKQGNNYGITNEAILLPDEIILETIRKVQERHLSVGAKQENAVLKVRSSESPCASTVSSDSRITVTTANNKSIISWRYALAAIHELGYLPPASSGPICGSNTFGRKPLVTHKHVKLMMRSTGTTYEEKILSMKGKKRERYESNMMKKQQPIDDQLFYERMTKHGGSGV